MVDKQQLYMRIKYKYVFTTTLFRAKPFTILYDNYHHFFAQKLVVNNFHYTLLPGIYFIFNEITRVTQL